MKQVLIDAEAEKELSESVGFYERNRAGLGLEFERAARRAVHTIQSDPERHPAGKNGVRRLVMERFPFTIHYLELREVIWILAFAHTSRKPGFWQRRSAHPPDL